MRTGWLVNGNFSPIISHLIGHFKKSATLALPWMGNFGYKRIRFFEFRGFLALSLFCGFVLLIGSCGKYKSSTFRNQPQCAHWSVLCCCQLRGVPVTIPFLLEKLPPCPSGHSLLQISEVLRGLGLETEGRVESEATFSSLSFPLIAHLTNPDHFIVIADIDDKVVHIYRSFQKICNTASEVNSS